MSELSERAKRIIESFEAQGSYVALNLSLRGKRTYEEAREVMRQAGFGKVDKKHTQSGDMFWLNVEECGPDHMLSVWAIHSNPPPTCRIEKRTRLIPKVETKEVGEQIEIIETVVVCDGKDGAL